MAQTTALSGLTQHIPVLWGFALAALGLILSPVVAVWISFHRRTVLLAREEANKLGLDHQHIERMFELETARNIGLREQERLTLIAAHDEARLDRVLDVELDFLIQLTRRMEAEVDSQLSALPTSQPVPAQVEKKAA